MITLEQINDIQCVEDLETLGIGRVDVDISHRGGRIGFYNADVSTAFDIPQEAMPAKIGAFCNYLGGGVRGTIGISTYNVDTVEKNKAELLTALANACKRVYQNIENEDGLNDEEDEEGETNWDALATKKARDAGTESAY